jgi:tetratricopeptide (TPR) repeat protein
MARQMRIGKQMPVRFVPPGCCRMTASHFINRARQSAIVLLSGLLFPALLGAQCSPVPQDAQSEPSKHTGPASGAPQFYDEPSFNVAGVADATNLGGHGSDTLVRTKETLAKDAVSLSRQPVHNTSAASDAEEKALREAVQRNPEDFDANHQLGKLLAASNRPAQAIPYLEKAAKLHPSDDNNALALALAYGEAGKYEDSRARLRALLARSDKAEVHHALGNVEEKLKHPLEAVREYQRAAELNSSEPYLFDWGTELLAHRAPTAAMEVFAKGNRLFPSSARMLIGMGVAWHAQGAFDRAADCVCQAADLNPSDSAPYVFLAKMQSAMAVEPPPVLERFRRFATIHPENALANYYYASALWKRENSAPEAATRSNIHSLLEKAIHLDPNLGPAHLLRGVVYSASGDWSQAVSAYQRAIAASPNLDEPHYRLAQVYRRLGEKAKAQREIQLYEQLSKAAAAEAERERQEIPQFVVALRDAKPGAAPPDKP